MSAPSSRAAEFERCLALGGLAVFPSDTVYGLACNPLDEFAVERLYLVKGRSRAKPCAVMFFDLDLALESLPELGPRTRVALGRVLPGPVGALLPNPAHRFPLACGDDPGTLGLRVIDGEVRAPVLQSSANRAGGADPRTLAEVPELVRAASDLVIDGGELPGTPSTLVDLRRYESDGKWEIVREGAVSAETIAAALEVQLPGGARRRGVVSSRTMPSELPPDFFNRPLAEVDPEIADVLSSELERQQQTLEMIASENFVPVSVLECQGSVLTNKYAEGYPGKRYYGGCEFIDIAEQLAIDRAKELFGAEHANVQPHAGAQANAAAYMALMDPGDVLMGMELAHGGHLTHGMKINFSGRLYQIAAYQVDPDTSMIDMDEVARVAREHKPKVILAGWSAYSRVLDFPRFREIADEVGAYLVVDMAHFAGLVAAGLHPSPVPHAHVVTTTIHKTLGGPRSGMILCKEEFAKKINSAVFPGQQGGPLEHAIAAKAVALKIAASDAFRERQERTVAGAKAVAEELLGAGAGVNVLTGGTDVHLVLCDLRESTLDGKQAEDRLAAVGITVNRNAVPFDPRPPAVSSGLRIGTPALATRGLQADDFTEVGRIIAEALQPDEFDVRRSALAERAVSIAERYPLYAALGVAPATV